MMDIMILVLSIMMFIVKEVCHADNVDLETEILCMGRPVPGVFIEAWDQGKDIYQ